MQPNGHIAAVLPNVSEAQQTEEIPKPFNPTAQALPTATYQRLWDVTAKSNHVVKLFLRQLVIMWPPSSIWQNVVFGFCI